MSKTNLPNCAFCGQQLTKDEEAKLTITVGFKPTLSDPNHFHAVGQWEGSQEFSHEDCWEARNRFAPARRRIIQIGTVDNDEDVD